MQQEVVEDEDVPRIHLEAHLLSSLGDESIVDAVIKTDFLLKRDA